MKIANTASKHIQELIYAGQGYLHKIATLISEEAGFFTVVSGGVVVADTRPTLSTISKLWSSSESTRVLWTPPERLAVPFREVLIPMSLDGSLLQTQPPRTILSSFPGDAISVMSALTVRAREAPGWRITFFLWDAQSMGIVGRSVLDGRGDRVIDAWQTVLGRNGA